MMAAIASEDPILVTGAAGFLGRHLMRTLQEAGLSAIALVRNLPSNGLSGCEIRCFNGLDPASVLLPGERYRAVINLATEYGRDRICSPVVASNVLMPIALFEAVQARGCRHWIEAGSYFMDAPNLGPLPEYVLSKRHFQAWAELIAPRNGATCVVADFHHLYGPGDRRDKFVPKLLAACRSGNDVPLTMGEQIRDFIHVRDATRALLALLDYAPGPGLHHVPVGTGQGTSVLAFARLMAALTGASDRLRPGLIPQRDDDPRWAVANPVILHGLGWRASMSLEDGLASLIADGGSASS